MNQESGKVIIFIGIAILCIGIIWYFFGNKLGFLGNLPGDIKIERDNFSFYFPITTMILLSLILNLIFKLFGNK
ncbi:MAG: DUF2905 domain-containing protein [Saprospiraceae bacterium]|nr:DUF2905 domain-containing protein [Saprospiraceae bacterium]